MSRARPMLVPNTYRDYYYLPRPDLTCVQCGRSFSRPSHLKRHNVIHIPPSQRRTITCEKCGSTFSRRDVLFRHLKVAHGLEYVPPTNQQRSCNGCVRRKLKCDRQMPCSACAKSKTAGPCEYPTIEELYDSGFQPEFQISEEGSDVRAMEPSNSKGSTHSDPLELATSLSKSSVGVMALEQNPNSDLEASAISRSPEGVASSHDRYDFPHPITHSSPGIASPQDERPDFQPAITGYSAGSMSSRNDHSDLAASCNNHSMGELETAQTDQQDFPSQSMTSTRPHESDFTASSIDHSTDTTTSRKTFYSDFTSSVSNRSRNDIASAQNGQYDLVTSPETYSSLSQPMDHLLLEADQLSPVFSGGPGLAEDAAVYNSSLNNGFQFDFRFSGFDWLDLDVPDIELGTTYLVPEGSIPSTAAHSGQPSRNQPSSTQAVQQKTSALHWPFEQGQESTSARCYLPPLRELLHGSLQTGNSTRTTALEGLIKILSEQKLSRFEEVVDPTILIGMDLLKKLLDVYFGNFQLIQPIFHPPTWNMDDCPTMLLGAMACLGAVLSDEPNAAELSSSISDVCSPIISWMGVSDTANYSNTSYLASLCLHQIYSLGSGNRQLYQNADRTRGVLFGSLRGLGLLKTRPSVQEDVDQNYYMPTNQDNLDADWRTWASKEKEVRIAWASFEYDCSLCTLTSRRGAVDVSELPPKLPCMDALWEAPSAYAWAALKSRVPPNSLGVSVSSVISAAIAGSPIPENISTWGKRLSGQVIGRLLWDLKQLELVSTTEYFGLSSLSTGQRQSKSSLLAALDRLLATMNNYIYTADLVSYNISSLLCHYSHLYTADDIMDMILYIVRSVVSRGPGHDQGVDMARRRLVSALGNDLRRARKLAWHAGQIVAVANEYLVSAPCEIMRLFMSYIFIVAYAQHLPRSEQPLNLVKVRLDVASHLPEQKRVVENWIQHGGPARVGSADDILADGAVKTIVQDAQVMLQRLRSWGLAEKFAKILQSFGNSGGY